MKHNSGAGAAGWRLVALMLVLVGAGACCSSKKPAFIEKMKAHSQRIWQDPVELDRNVRAMTHFSYAQQLAVRGKNDEALKELRAALKDDPGSAFLRTTLADGLYRQGNNDEALKLIDESIKLDPAEAAAHQVRGMVLMAIERPADAEQSFLNAARLDPDDPEYVINVADARMAQKKPEDAFAVLAAYANTHPEDLDVQYYMAAILLQVGQVDKARARYHMILSREPGYYPAQADLFRMEQALGRYDAAIKAGYLLLSYYPGDANTRMQLVGLLLRRGRQDEAIAVLDGGKKSGAVVPDWWLQKGYILLRRSQAEAAKAEFDAALALDPTSVEATMALGLAETVLGHYLDAASYFEAVPKDNKLYGDARRQLALLALKQGETRRAVELMEELYAANPDDANMAMSYSAVLRDVGDYGKAEEVVNAALSKHPDDNALRAELALTYYAQGRVEASIAVMRKVLDQDPANADALNFIGYTWAEQGVNLDQAESHIRRALEINPDSGAVMDSLGWVYFQRGDYQSAMEWLQKALAAIGPDPEVLEHVGDCFRAQGDLKQAKDNYQKALDNATALRIKERVRKKLEELE
ncbi:MAG TPA: tetratricopeptide repeat protein [bacterium]|nr:tetratricopeptide repeat protein [bacterium]